MVGGEPLGLRFAMGEDSLWRSAANPYDLEEDSLRKFTHGMQYAGIRELYTAIMPSSRFARYGIQQS